MEASLLNHASVMLKMGDVILLTDPWFDGTVFDNGWELKWHNSDAYDKAASATHMWISHPHSDHLHTSTLKRILEINPNIIVIANVAYNYDLEKQFRHLGFYNVIPCYEGQIISLSADCTIERIGSGIIDSLMVIRWKNFITVNLNDCVLQPYALKYVLREIGAIDLLLCNFNHAGKLLHYPEQLSSVTRNHLEQHFQKQIEILKPKYVLPFASLHRYISPYAITQNESMLEPSELTPFATINTQVLTLYPGQHTSFGLTDNPTASVVNNLKPHLVGQKQSISTVSNDTMNDEKQLESAIHSFERRVSNAYGILRVLLPTLKVKIEDKQQVIFIKRGKITVESCNNTPCDIASHSNKIAHWFKHPFGTDTFVVGAHFRIERSCIGKLKFFIAMMLLAEAKVAPGYMLKKAFWKFLWQRKHEVFGALLNFRVTSSYQ